MAGSGLEGMWRNQTHISGHWVDIPEQKCLCEVSTIERNIIKIDGARVVEYEMFADLGQLMRVRAFGEDNSWVWCHFFPSGCIGLGVVVVEEDKGKCSSWRHSISTRKFIRRLINQHVFGSDGHMQTTKMGLHHDCGIVEMSSRSSRLQSVNECFPMYLTPLLVSDIYYIALASPPLQSSGKGACCNESHSNDYLYLDPYV